MMKVFLSPRGTHSRAMTRIANALTLYAPLSWVKPVTRQKDADLILLHVINQDAIPYAQSLTARGQKYAVVQCCLKTAGLSQESDWHEFWRQSVVLWSYYYLPEYARSPHAANSNYYHAPLGIDSAFRQYTSPDSLRRDTILTTGYVTGPGAEAIQEVWQAADRLGLTCVHIGPSSVSGMTYRPFHWQSYKDISDEALSTLLRRVSWVASLRHVEGFELPAAEGLACGARPVLFDQPDLKYWYGEHAEYVPECEGEELVDRLTEVFSRRPRPVSESERQSVIQRFDWRRIAEGFWKMVMERV